MSAASDIPFLHVLDPMERISETLFGLIMALTFICSLGVATAGNIKIQNDADRRPRLQPGLGHC